MRSAPGPKRETLSRRGRALLALLGLAAAVNAPLSAALAEPLPHVLAPEPLHAADEREFPPATLRAYQQTMELGLSEFGAGHWAPARALFRRGHQLLPNARSSRVLGMTAFNLGLYPAAVRELSEALSDPRRPLRGTLREETEGLHARAEALVGRYRVLLEPASAELRVDGLVTQLEQDGTLLLAVGEHLLELEAPEHVAFIRTLLVDGRDDGLLVLRLRSRATAAALPQDPRNGTSGDTSALENLHPARSWKQWLFADYRGSWAVGAGTLALGGAALAVHLAAREEARAVEARCPGICRPWDDDTARRDRLDGWSQGLLIGSLACAVTTVVLALIERERSVDRARENRKTRFAPLRQPL